MITKPVIVHIITRLEPGGSSRNTVDSCVAQAADYGVVLLAGPHPESWTLRRLLPPEVNYIEVPALQREISPLKDLRALLALRRHLALLAPDLVHTHTSKAGALGRLAARLTAAGTGRRPVVVHTPHGHLLYGYYGPVKTFVFRCIERAMARITDHFIALTPGEMRESLSAGIGLPRQWRVVHSGINLAAPASPAQKADLGLGPEDIAAGTVARLERVKGVEYLVRAVALVRDRRPELRLKCVRIGGGPLEDSLRALAARLGIQDRVIFTGFRADAARLLPALDIYVQPSLNEAMGRAPLEAQAMGRPVVVSGVCGLPDVIREGETGFLVPPADPAALASALEHLAADPALRAGMGEAAKAWALSRGEAGLPRFGTESMNAKLKTFYNEVLPRGRKGE